MKRLTVFLMMFLLAAPAAWAQGTLKVGEVVVTALRAEDETDEATPPETPPTPPPGE